VAAIYITFVYIFTDHNTKRNSSRQQSDDARSTSANGDGGHLESDSFMRGNLGIIGGMTNGVGHHGGSLGRGQKAPVSIEPVAHSSGRNNGDYSLENTQNCSVNNNTCGVPATCCTGNEYYVETPDYTFILPDINHYPDDFKSFVNKDLIETSTLVALEQAGQYNRHLVVFFYFNHLGYLG